jgi:hypothetical protein
MKKRPLPVTIIGWLFIGAGLLGFAFHATEFNPAASLDADLALVLVVRLLAIVGGVFLLRAANWARWLLILWLVYHVILSTMHPVMDLVTHIALLLAIAYFLLRPKTASYFSDGGSPTGQANI